MQNASSCGLCCLSTCHGNLTQHIKLTSLMVSVTSVLWYIISRAPLVYFLHAFSHFLSLFPVNSCRFDTAADLIVIRWPVKSLQWHVLHPQNIYFSKSTLRLGKMQLKLFTYLFLFRMRFTVCLVVYKINNKH